LASIPDLATRTWRLPSTLYDETHVTATGYSKVSRGLHFPLEVPGLYTRKECSEDSSWGQWEPRYAIHAGRQSNDKAFRYLKRVIVTPAVYLLLARLEPSLKYRHWADVTIYTNLFRLADSYVFVKQSGPPSHCALRLQTYIYKRRDPLNRSYGAKLPSSLN
jgi:hypothetical protein